MESIEFVVVTPEEMDGFLTWDCPHCHWMPKRTWSANGFVLAMAQLKEGRSVSASMFIRDEKLYSFYGCVKCGKPYMIKFDPPLYGWEV
jgi:hypothetical protein